MWTEIFLFLIIVFAVITVVGHGIWIAVAWVLRALMSGTRQPDRPTLLCPWCEQSTPVDTGRCLWCGRGLFDAQARTLTDLAGTRRKIQQWKDQGKLTAELADGQLSQIRAERHNLLGTGQLPTRPEIATAAPAEIIEAIVVETAAPATPFKTPAPSAQPVTPAPIEKPKKPAAPTEPVVRPTARVAPTLAPSGPSAPAAKPMPPAKPRPPAVERPPRKSWGEIVMAFLEEREIPVAELLGVLLGGLLVMTGSVSLVIYFWETLQESPVLKFAACAAATLAPMGVGLAAWHRWQLRTTSRGLLVISLLLVPLGFLAVASSGGEWTVVLAEIGVLALFGYLITLVGRVLVPDRPWHLAAAILAPVAMIVVAAIMPAVVSRPWSLGLFGACTAAVFAAPLVLHRRMIAAMDSVGLRTLIGAFILLGTSLFPLGFALGLAGRNAAMQLGSGAVAADSLSFGLSFAAAAILAFALTLNERLADQVKLTSWRASATAVALISVLGMLGGLILAWPLPTLVLAVGVLDTVVLMWIALACRFPWAHAGAIATGVIAYLTGYHLLAGHLAEIPPEAASATMIRAIFAGQSAAALVVFCGLLGGAAAWLAKCGRTADANIHGCGAAVVAAISLVGSATAAWFEGGSSVPIAMTVFALYGLAALVANAWIRLPVVTHAGLTLVVGATGWGLYWLVPTPTPLWAAVLGIEALLLAVAGLVLGRYGEHENADFAKRIKAYHRPVLDVADTLAGLTLAVAAVIMLPKLDAWTQTVWPIVALATAAGAWLIIAWARVSPERAWAGSMTVLLLFVHTFVYNFPDLLHQPWLDAVLLHATLAVGAALACQLGFRRSGERLRERLRSVFTEPISQSAALSSTLALPLFFISPWEHALTLSLCLFWLSAIWLVVAAVNRLPELVTAAQAVMCVAAVAAAAAWMQRYPWDASGKIDLGDLRTWQTYGVALAVLTLAWAAARCGLQRFKQATELLNPAWPSLDRIVGGGLCAIQLVVAVGGLLPALGYELGTAPAALAMARQAQVASPAAWLLLAVLAACCVVVAWQRWRDAELIAGLLVLGTLPWLVAAQWGTNLDAASALRWASAAILALGTAAVCLRRPATAWAQSIGMKIETTELAPRIARATVLATTLLPVLGLTLYAALVQITGTAAKGPATGTFFATIGTEAAYLVPLLAATVALVALAVRESSSEYAFSAGLVTKLALVLACLLSVSRLGAFEWALACYLITIASAVWAAVWLIARRYVDVWREDAPGIGSLLMRLELGIGAAAAALVLVPGMIGLIDDGPGNAATISLAAGGWLGWVAFGSLIAVTVWRQFDLGHPVPADLAGFVGLVLIGLTACTVSLLLMSMGPSPDGGRWGYHTMMIGWAAYSVLIALSTWWMAEHVRVSGAEGPPQALIRAANVWVITAGALAVLLGLLAALAFRPAEERLWGATAIALASTASATMAVWRRREVWAFVSGLGVNVAASFTVAYYERVLGQWPGFLLLVQANVIAGAVVALAWLAVRRRLYVLKDRAVWSGPLLTVQIALTAAGAMALVVPAMVALVASPDDLPLAVLRQIGSAPGAVAVLLAAMATGWYVQQLQPKQVIHVVGATALAGGVLLGAGALGWAEWLAVDAWLPYHVMIAAWAAFGLILLALGVVVSRQSDEDGSVVHRIAALLPAETTAMWHYGLTLAATMAGLIWCAVDPHGPYWGGGVMLAAATGAIAAALWRRQSADVLLSAVLINLAGGVAWVAWREHPLAGLIETNVLCLAAGAILWSALEQIAPRRVAKITLENRTYSYPEIALLLGTVLLAGLAVVLVSMTLLDVAHPSTNLLTWWAVVALAAAQGVRLLTGGRQFALSGLYYLALIAVALGLDVRGLSARHLLWLAGPEMAGCVLAAAVVYLVLRRVRLGTVPIFEQRSETKMGLSPWGDSSGEYGFGVAQCVVAAVIGVLATVVALDANFSELVRPELTWLAPGRWSGPLALAALLPGCLAMAQSVRTRQQSPWRYATLIAGSLLVATGGWAWLPTADVNLLNQTVVLMVAAVLTLLAAGLGLPRCFPDDNPWVACGRSLIAPCGGLAAAALAAVLVQEGVLFEPEVGAPTAGWAVVVVTVALAATIVALIVLAVSPQRDPLGLSEQGRTAYVYAAEVLGVLIALHLWLARPNLFQLGIVEQYWMLLVIGIAFAGAGLSEWFQRLGLPVLSRPLANTAVLLPLIPAVGYWLPTGVAPVSSMAGDSPAVWFCGSLFYAVMATTRRSRGYSFLALGTLAAAFCLLWQKMDLGLTEHVQLYGIPIGLAILLAEQIHHREMPKQVASTMRYVALTFIYLTSSAEFLWELGETFWMPVTLIGLSVGGIFLGIFLRIRSFVVVGFTSLVLVLGALVYYAAVDRQQSQVLAVALLALAFGIPILAFFMVFEKKKEQIRAVAARFWNWERRDLTTSEQDTSVPRP